jgi:Tol biopolymer transport system component
MGNKNSLWTMDADGQNRHKIVDYGANWHPWACWSPDGKRLAVIDNEYDEGRHPANYHLDVMDADGGHRRTLVSKALWMSMPDWR